MIRAYGVLDQPRLRDLAGVAEAAARTRTELAIVGAIAMRCFVGLDRHTADIDLVVALDLPGFGLFAASLSEAGWMREKALEHRWRGPAGSTVDLLPAGPELRAAGRIVWPVSGFTMTLAGFGHVFEQSIPVEFDEGVSFPVAPPPVLALLKAAAYHDDPYRRRKDLGDIQWLFGKYEAGGDRIFSDEVFAANLPDIELAPAFLLGYDLGRLVSPAECELLGSFIRACARLGGDANPPDFPGWRERQASLFERQLRAFDAGLATSFRQAGRS